MTNAPSMSHTVGLLYPDSAQVRAAPAGRNPGVTNCWGLNKVKRASTVTSVRPINAIAAPGSGSRIRPTITPAKIEKYSHAKCANPGGGGKSARITVTASGAITCHLGIFDSVAV